MADNNINYRNEDNHDQDHGDHGGDLEVMIPIANVGRLMKQILPRNAKVSKEAKERMQECATEFISFVTAEASDRCRRERRKTLNADDLCWALQSLGLDLLAGPTIRYLHRYREALINNNTPPVNNPPSPPEP